MPTRVLGDRVCARTWCQAQAFEIFPPTRSLGSGKYDSASFITTFLWSAGAHMSG